MNKEAEGEAWFIKLEIKDASELKSLMGKKNTPSIVKRISIELY